MNHKAGFVNIIGKPNVGKSTLMNALVGEKLSIITSKAQTTRHRIMGIVNGENFQIVYSDTPGIIKPAYKLQESMMNEVGIAFTDADIILYVVEVGEKDIGENISEKIKKASIPVILAINKIDLSNQSMVNEKIVFLGEKFPSALIIPVSAITGFNLDYLFETILKKLPEHPAYFPKDELTDRSMRFFISEIIREKIFNLFRKEIPYSVEIIVDSFKEKNNLVIISAYIFVSRESQKIILIGRKGQAIKKLGTEARKDIEKFLEKKVFLELSVKVDKDWRNNELALKRFGYQV